MQSTEEIASASLHPADFTKSRLKKPGERDQQCCSIQVISRRSGVSIKCF